MKYENTFKAIDQKRFPYLNDFQTTATQTDSLEYKIGEIFSELHNKIRSGFNMREIIKVVGRAHAPRDLRFADEVSR